MRNVRSGIRSVARGARSRLRHGCDWLQVATLGAVVALPTTQAAYLWRLLGFGADKAPVKKGVNLLTEMWQDFAPALIMVAVLMAVIGVAKMRSGMADGAGSSFRWGAFILLIALAIPTAQ